MAELEKCHACGVEKDPDVLERYPYPAEDSFATGLLPPLFTLECQPYAPEDEQGPWKLPTVCHECLHRLQPDMWISSDCWAKLNPVVPFLELPNVPPPTPPTPPHVKVGDVVQSTFRAPWTGVVLEAEPGRSIRVRVTHDRRGRPVVGPQKARWIRLLHESWLTLVQPAEAQPFEELVRPVLRTLPALPAGASPPTPGAFRCLLTCRCRRPRRRSGWPPWGSRSSAWTTPTTT